MKNEKIAEAYDCIQPSCEAKRRVLNNVISRTHSGEKPKRIVRKGFVAALIAASLMVITVSAAYHMGAFERLGFLIGQERADELTPLEIGNADKIAIELVAIEVTADIAYIYFTMQDLVANRLDGEFFISHSLVPVIPVDDFMVTMDAPEIIHRDDTGVVTFRSRFAYSHEIEGLELTYSIREIRFGEIHHPLQVVDINLTEFTDIAPTVLLQTSNPALSAEGIGSEYITGRYMAQIMGDGLPVLEPHMLDKDFGLAGVQATISGIGVINERLHIQIYLPNMRNSNVIVGILHRSYAEMLEYDDIWQHSVSPLFSTQFQLRADGSLGRDSYVGDTHVEAVYDINLDTINEYVLVVSGFGAERIDVDWSVTF
jgi:hypothetical protein